MSIRWSVLLWMGICFLFLWTIDPAQAADDRMKELRLQAGGYPISTALSNPGAGKFQFVDARGNSDKPITVWYYRPEHLSADHQIVFVMHGGGRNGMGYRHPWIDHAIEHKFLLVVPEFSREHYGDNYYYNYGNVATRSGEPIEESKWTFSAIEHLFDDLKANLKFKRDTYCIYGHSAGAQFVHRMLLFKPYARIDKAIAANAGWYTLPTFKELFPAGLLNSIASPATQRESLKKKLYVLLGDLDTSVSDPNLPRLAAAKAQGKHRFERGQTFFHTGQKVAAGIKTPFSWELHIAPNIGHSHIEMAAPAVSLLFEKPGVVRNRD